MIKLLSSSGGGGGGESVLVVHSKKCKYKPLGVHALYRTEGKETTGLVMCVSIDCSVSLISMTSRMVIAAAYQTSHW